MLYLFGCSGLYFAQNALLFPGRSTQGTADAADWPNRETERVDLTLADGTPVVARFRPADPAAHVPTVIFFYGNAMCAAWCDGIADLLHGLGCNVLIADYPGYGLSGGKPSEAGFYATADALWQYLHERPGVDQDRIVVMGWSLGSAVAIDLASRMKPAGLITLSAFTSVKDVARRHYPLVPVGLLLSAKFDNLAKAPRVVCPTLIVHGQKDTLIDPHMGQTLHDAIAGSDLVWLADADHNGMFEADPPTLTAAIRKLLARAMPTTQPTRG